MKQINETEIETSETKLSFEIPIKKIIEYKDFFVVLIRERKEIPNNIIAYDYSGKELWRINDIVKAKIPRGYDDMEKISDYQIKVYYELGIIYEIDIDKKMITDKTYMR